MKIHQLLTTVAVLTVTSTTASAVLTAQDSSGFANQYNGNQLFDGTNLLNDWVADGGATDANVSANGSNIILSLTENNGWIQHNNDATPWDLASGSWTVETQAKVSPNGGVGGFVIWGALNNERQIMTILEDSVRDHGGTVYSSDSNTDAFHTFRLAYDDADDTYHFFRDGIQIASGLDQQDGTGHSRLILGDCCTNSGGGPLGGPGTDVEFRYIRYDNTGAFSPIPEPSTSLLIGLAGLGLFVRRRR